MDALRKQTAARSAALHRERQELERDRKTFIEEYEGKLAALQEAHAQLEQDRVIVTKETVCVCVFVCFVAWRQCPHPSHVAFVTVRRKS